MSSAMFSWIDRFQDIFGPPNRLEWNVDDAVVLKNKDDGFYGHFDLHIHFFFSFGETTISDYFRAVEVKTSVIFYFATAAF